MFVLEREVTTAVLITVSTGIRVIVSLLIQVSQCNLNTLKVYGDLIYIYILGTTRSR